LLEVWALLQDLGLVERRGLSHPTHIAAVIERGSRVNPSASGKQGDGTPAALCFTCICIVVLVILTGLLGSCQIREQVLRVVLHRQAMKRFHG
jgi:hypothetical protein